MTDNKKNIKRWQLRFRSFKKAHERFAELAQLDLKLASEIEKEALIQRFEYTFELARNLLRDYLLDQDSISRFSAKDIFRYSYRNQYIRNGQIWLDALEIRNKTSYVYNSQVLEHSAHFIRDQFAPELEALRSYFLIVEEKVERNPDHEIERS